MLWLMLSLGFTSPSFANPTEADDTALQGVLLNQEPSEVQTGPEDAWEREIAALAGRIAPLSFSKRIEAIARAWVGRPYGVGGPLGEGPGGRYDQDPLYRTDTFDCTTFVETVLALANTEGPDVLACFRDEMNALRYRNGQVSYADRNHIIETDWTPLNSEAGYVRDATLKAFGKDNVREARAWIDKKSWYRAKKLEDLKLIAPRSIEARKRLLKEWIDEGKPFAPTRVSLPYVPKQRLLALKDRLPALAVLNIVRPDWNVRKRVGTNLLISHQALLTRSDLGLRVWHASSARRVQKVVEQSLEAFVSQHLMREASIGGVQVLEILDAR